ncbi:MAG: hypothetical protein K2Y71_13525 [Xanthobacteraceae bacterium]|nr:hypothetical protein [Xanthobacteraceae bacterium]
MGADYADSSITDLFENSMNKSQTVDVRAKFWPLDSGLSHRIVANVEILKSVGIWQRSNRPKCRGKRKQNLERTSKSGRRGCSKAHETPFFEAWIIHVLGSGLIK